VTPQSTIGSALRSPVNVLYVVPHLRAGGTEHRFVRLLETIDRARYLPLVACVDGFGELHERVVALGIQPKLLGRKTKFDPAALAHLAALVRRERPAILHSWLYLANLYGRIAGRLGRALAVVASETGALQTVSPTKQTVMRMVDRALAPLTDCVVANSEAVRAYVRGSGVPSSKIVVIPNGVPVPRLPDPERAGELRRSLGVDGGEPLVGMISRFDSDFKDHHTFLHAAKLVRNRRTDVRFVLVGDGSGRQSIEQLAHDLGLGSALTFAGYRDDAQDLASVLDVSVLCSLSEGLSNVILESMAVATPVVATAIPANQELIEQEVSGILVPVGDAGATAGAITRLLDDRALAQELAGRARQLVEERFSLSRQAELTMTLYDRLIAERSRR
jgi:L-malate glycosyltransferase